MFHPKDGGRPSYGVTDEQGRYVLEYSLEEVGAEIGTCQVTISTADESDEADSKPSKELIPQRYKDDPIEVNVERKTNVIDIVLTSK